MKEGSMYFFKGISDLAVLVFPNINWVFFLQLSTILEYILNS